jgi:hypothetical protein
VGEIDTWDGLAGPNDEAGVVGATRLLFEPDFVTQHLWGQLAGVASTDAGGVAQRKRRAKDAVWEYLALLSFVRENACTVASSLRAVIVSAQETVDGGALHPKRCVLKVNVENVGTSDTTLDLDGVRVVRPDGGNAPLVQVDDASGRIGPGPSGKVRIGSFASAQWMVDIGTCDTHEKVVFPHPGVWPDLEIDLNALAVPVSSLRSQNTDEDCANLPPPVPISSVCRRAF